MFQEPKALSASAHQALRYSPPSDYRFAAAELTCPVFISELSAIAREYPIVFPKSATQPCALLGVEQGVNAYVAEDGQWLAHYIPSHIRRYPFVLAKAGEGDAQQQRYTIAFDAQSELLGEQGEPLFDPSGERAQVLRNVLKLLEGMEKEARQLIKITRALEDYGLLVETNMVVKRKGQADAGIQGVRMVDEKKLQALPLEAFDDLRKMSALPVIYAHLLSMANLRQGTIAGKYPMLADRSEAANNVPEHLDELFGEGDDDFTFDFDS